jgi:hypothetical protein
MRQGVPLQNLFSNEGEPCGDGYYRNTTPCNMHLSLCKHCARPLRAIFEALAQWNESASCAHRCAVASDQTDCEPCRSMVSSACGNQSYENSREHLSFRPCLVNSAGIPRNALGVVMNSATERKGARAMSDVPRLKPYRPINPLHRQG